MKTMARAVGALAAVILLVAAGAGARAPGTAGPGLTAVATEAASLANKGGDGAACSSGDECNSGTCEGGSCCTAHGDTCDSTSHCCGHQSCTDGSCP